MKRFALSLVFICTILPLCTQSALAYESISSIDSSELLREQYESSGADRLDEALPDDTREIMQRLDISIPDMTEAYMPDTEAVINELLSQAAQASGKPLASCGAIIAVTAICAILEGMRGSGSSPLSQTTATAGTVAVCAIIISPVALHISECAETLSGLCRFLEVFYPVCAAIMLASGSTVGAGCFSASMLTITELMSAAVDGYILELLKTVLALGCVSAAAPAMKLNGAVGIIDRFLKWSLSMLAVIFTGVLGVRCTISGTIDKTSAKTAKFIVSGSVPVIGGTIGEAMQTVQGCIGVLRSSTAGFGLIALGFIIAVPLVKTLVWKAGIDICGLVAGVFGVKPVEELMRSAAEVLSMLVSIIVFAGVLTIGTTAIALGGCSV